jgi:hypothetical protein
MDNTYGIPGERFWKLKVYNVDGKSRSYIGWLYYDTTLLSFSFIDSNQAAYKFKYPVSVKTLQNKWGLPEELEYRFVRFDEVRWYTETEEELVVNRAFPQ